MRAQDGWIVRVRPVCASINAGQWATLSALALSHAHPQIELTRLGNVQLRGITDAQLPVLLSQLVAARLIPAPVRIVEITGARHDLGSSFRGEGLVPLKLPEIPNA